MKEIATKLNIDALTLPEAQKLAGRMGMTTGELLEARLNVVE